MKEKVVPSEAEKEDAAKRIRFWLDMEKNQETGASMIRTVLNKYVPRIEEAYARRFVKEEEYTSAYLDDNDLPKFLVDMMSVELFEGEAGFLLRYYLLKNIFAKRPSLLRSLIDSDMEEEEAPQEKKRDEITAKKALEDLTNKRKTKWIPGGFFARKFVETLGFPPIFEGISSEPRPGRVEEVIPRTQYFHLTKFQENMKNQILKILSDHFVEKRAIVSLPTGAGKTKTVAEAILEFWAERTSHENKKLHFILWVAQTEELCEQALSCFKQIWEEKGTGGEELNIFRAWGGRSIPYSDEEGIIIAGIDQLYSISKKSQHGDGGNRSDLKRLTGEGVLGGVFIDEAHRSWAKKYREVLKQLEIPIVPSPMDHVPLIGLTATPERTAEGETDKLRHLYGNNRIYPRQEFEPAVDEHGNRFDSSWSDLNQMKKNLTSQGFLAEAKYHYIDPGKHFQMTDNETKVFEEKNSFDPEFLKKIGTNSARNNVTYQVLKKWVEAENRQVLFFGANVHQALLMSRFLEDDKIRSATITGNTRYGARKAHVRMFREGEIKVLCNYEVLTTGFDVPKIDTIVIARPTNSRIVYQQMVGRGLRGPNFNGTKTCDIITIEDKIRDSHHNEIELGYMEYKKDQMV